MMAEPALLPRGSLISGPYSPNRRELFAVSAFGASAFAQPKAGDKAAPRKKYPFKKSINLWAFPYPEKMTLEQCLKLAKDAGFDGIELNYDLDSDLSPKSGPKEFAAIRKTAAQCAGQLNRADRRRGVRHRAGAARE